MPRRFQFAALLLLVLWLPATLHCRIEEAGLSAVFACNESTPAEAGDGRKAGCADDSCRTIESGQFFISKEILVPAASFAAPCECLTCALDIHAPAPAPALSPGYRTEPRPWQRTWQFVRRAAPPVRAPDSLNV